MTKRLAPLFLLCCIFSCQTNKALIQDNVSIKIYPYEHEGENRASAMPELNADSELMPHKRRFEYLLMNASKIHSPEQAEQRNSIFNLYPDTTKLAKLYLNEYVQDKKLVYYFEATLAPINEPNLEKNTTYSSAELMEVASKFFYCDKVKPDTSVQAHICIGLNGVTEANWEKDYTLLEAFCYEGIFTAFDSEDSQIWEIFVSEKAKACLQYKANISTLDQYLEDVKRDLFERMQNDNTLKTELLSYYEANKTNLAFRIEN